MTDVLDKIDAVIADVPPGEKLVTLEEAALLVGKRARTIKSWVDKGHLTATHKGRRRHYFKAKHVWEAEKAAREANAATRFSTPA